MKNDMNIYSQALIVVGWLVLVVGVIGSIFLGDSMRTGWEYNTSICIAGILCSGIFALLLLGLGEIINILDDNRKFLKKLANPPEVSAPEDELPDL